MKYKRKKSKLAYMLLALCVTAGIVAAYVFFIRPVNYGTAAGYVYIDNDDTSDSVLVKLEAAGHGYTLTGYGTLAALCGYDSHVKSGRYAIKPGESVFTVFRKLKNGLQSPVSLTIPSVRTIDRLSAELAKRLMVDSAQIMKALTDESVCQRLGYDTATIAAMFIPNTYDIYWNTSVDALLERMKKENTRFWNSSGRIAKAKAMNLSPVEVYTLASIIDEETANNGEKPMVAGMYYNRLTLRNGEYPQGMPLQADPTIKFAWKKFELRRIYHSLLDIDSPYNTYRYPGLPPGPIRIASVAGIDAVLNHVKHDYIYMCAKEDFSGTHNFARNYGEHLANARKYAEALNRRGIR